MAIESFYKEFIIDSEKEFDSLIRAFNNRKPIIIDRNLVNEEKEN